MFVTSESKCQAGGVVKWYSVEWITLTDAGYYVERCLYMLALALEVPIINETDDIHIAKSCTTF